MSIEVTRLSYSQGTDMTVLKDWFDSNADDFFDSTEISGDSLLLKISGSTAMTISHVNSTMFTVTVSVNGSLTLTKSTGGGGDYVARLAKTSHGIALSFSKNYGGPTDPAREYAYGLFITKTNAGNTGVVLAGNLSCVIGTTDILNSGFYYESINGSLRSTAATVTAAVLADDVTTLTPCICEGANGDYMPDCFFTSFSQYKGQDCIFTADGSEYLYNGFIALR